MCKKPTHLLRLCARPPCCPSRRRGRRPCACLLSAAAAPGTCGRAMGSERNRWDLSNEERASCAPRLMRQPRLAPMPPSSAPVCCRRPAQASRSRAPLIIGLVWLAMKARTHCCGTAIAAARSLPASRSRSPSMTSSVLAESSARFRSALTGNSFAAAASARRSETTKTSSWQARAASSLHEYRHRI